MATTEVEQHVKVETEGGVGWIRLNRPEKMNAIGAVTRRQLGDAIKQVERDESMRVVVLTGSGRAFCSGADVTEMAQSGDGGMRTPEDVGNVLRNEYMPMLTRLRTMPKPVIAALNGPAVGIGASYALACDIRIAVPEAYLLEAFINIGLAPIPTAGPFMAAITGLGMERKRVSIGMYSVRSTLPTSSGVRIPPSLWAISVTSAPEQNARPDPVRTTTRTASSRSTCLIASPSWRRVSAPIAFIFSGRFSWMTPTPSWTRTVTCCSTSVVAIRDASSGPTERFGDQVVQMLGAGEHRSERIR